MTREQLTTYLDSLTITSENIGKIRRDLMVPFDCEWNAWVRDETAAREVSPAPVGESANFPEFRIKVLQNTVKGQAEQIAGLRQELAAAHAIGRQDDGEMGRLRQELSHVQRHRDFLEGELHKRDEQLDAVKIERDAAEAKCELLQAQLQDLAERNVNLRTAKVTAENELRRIRQANIHCVLPAYKPLREEMWRRALAIILVKSPAIDSQWGKLSDDMRQFISGIFSLILDTLPQLDVTTRHPSGSSEPGDRNPSGPLSGRVGNSENGQTSIASEDR